MSSQIQTIEYVVIVGYLLVVLAVAGALRRSNGNVSDYFRNGCKGKWWLVGSSGFMTAFSAWTFTGASGVAFESGWSAMVLFIANAAGFLLNALLFAPWFRQLRAISVPEVVRARFGAATQQLYAVIAFTSQVLFSSLHLYGLSIFTAAVFGFDIRAVIVVIGGVVLAYSMVGGSWAVMATDFIQCVILLLMTLLATLLCLEKLGGVEAMFDLIRDKGLSEDFRVFNSPDRFAGEFTITWAMAIFLKQVIGHNSLASAVRYFGVKDGREARKAAVLACVLMSLGSFIWFIPPITARLLYADAVMDSGLAKPAEAAYAVASMQLLPAGMTGLMVVAIFAATMSSMDSGLNRNAAVFVNDIYPALCRMLRRTPASGTRLLSLGRVCTLVFGLIVIGTTLKLSMRAEKGIFQAMLDLQAIISVPLSIPLIMGLLVKRAPSWSGIVTIAVTAVPSAMGFMSGHALVEGLPLVGEPWAWQTKLFLNLGVGTLTFLLTTAFWRGVTTNYREQVASFFRLMKTPVDFDREVGRDNDWSQYRLMGTTCVTIGFCVSLLGFLPNHPGLSGRGGILLVSGAMAGVGIGLLFCARRHPRNVGVRPGGEEKG